MNTGAPDVVRLGELALAWLSTRAEGRGPRGDLARALKPFVESWWTAGEWSGRLDELLAGLEREGLISASGRNAFALTPEGRRRAFAALGVERLPRGTTWRQVKARHLMSLALGLKPERETLERLGDADGLVAALISREHKLAPSKAPTLAQARDRLLWRQLGLESERPFTLEAVRAVLLGRVLRSSREHPSKVALRLLAARASGARRADPEELRLATVRGWLAPAAQGQPAAEPVAVKGGGLEDFAQRVLEAARASTTGKFGERRVFISHVYRALRAALSVDEPTFKQRLLEANRARLLTLARADLVDVMDPADVAASEIRYLGATFHFIAL